MTLPELWAAIGGLISVRVQVLATLGLLGVLFLHESAGLVRGKHSPAWMRLLDCIVAPLALLLVVTTAARLVPPL